MPDGFLLSGPYRSPPSSDDERIVAPITACKPEQIPGLAWTRPDFSALGHKIIRTFAIDGKKRPDGVFIRCAICSGDHPKFLDGAVLWSPDRFLRLIGHVCAAKPQHFGEARYRSLRKQRQQEELDAVALNWLSAYALSARSLIPTIEATRTFALHIEEQRRIFFRDVEPLATILANRARRKGGELSVMQESSGSRLVEAYGNTAESLYEELVVGMMRGGAFVSRPKFPRSRQLKDVVKALEMIPDGDGEEPILKLIDHGGEQAITVAAAAVFRALQRASSLADECADAAEFFKEENLSLLAGWGSDPRNTLKFSLRRFSRHVEFTLEDRSRVTLSTNWPSLPDLASLHHIVEAGFQLDSVLPH